MIPISICWNVTSACNLNCGFCYRARDLRQLDPRHWAYILERISQAGIRRIVFGGGEPFLVRQFDELLAEAKRQKLFVSVITNGTRQNEAVRAANDGLIDEVVTSIDGPSREAQFLIRGGTPELLSKQIFLLSALTNSSLRLRVNTVAMKGNRRDIPRIGELFQNLRLDEWHIMQFYPLHDSIKQQAKFSISPGEFEELCAELESRWGSSIPLIYGTNDSMSRAYLSIDPDGMVYTSTPSSKLVLGSIFSVDFSKVLDDQLSGEVHTAKYLHVKDWL